MAQLTEEQRAELSADLQREWSNIWTVIPMNKANLALMLEIFDAGLENAETTILNNVSVAARTWLLANIPLSRYVLAKTAEKRAEVL